MGSALQPLLPANRPLLILAPMQDVTDLPFWRVMHRYGDPDLYYTEYFRVYADSRPERHILESIDRNPTGRPVIAQMIGQDLPALVRTAQALQRHAVAGIDLNLGCPAPIVCRKNAGGGLLRNPDQIDRILGALREAISCAFTVKTRIGFDTPEEFPRLLEVFRRHAIDALTVHGRTVREMYRTAVHHDRIRDAVEAVSCPVFANGNVLSVRLARETRERTGAAGLMIGRGAIRNPWIFRQIGQDYAGMTPFQPSLQDLREYIRVLYEETTPSGLKPEVRVAKMKKYLNFIGQGVDGDGAFLNGIRRAQTPREFFAVCDASLDSDELFAAEPPEAALICRRSEQMAAV